MTSSYTSRPLDNNMTPQELGDRLAAIDYHGSDVEAQYRLAIGRSGTRETLSALFHYMLRDLVNAPREVADQLRIALRAEIELASTEWGKTDRGKNAPVPWEFRFGNLLIAMLERHLNDHLDPMRAHIVIDDRPGRVLQEAIDENGEVVGVTWETPTERAGQWRSVTYRYEDGHHGEFPVTIYGTYHRWAMLGGAAELSSVVVDIVREVWERNQPGEREV